MEQTDRRTSSVHNPELLIYRVLIDIEQNSNWYWTKM